MLEKHTTTEELVKQLLDKLKERISKNKESWKTEQEHKHETKL